MLIGRQKEFFSARMLFESNNKTVLMILLWHSVNNLMYFLLFDPSSFYQITNSSNCIFIAFLEAVLSLFSFVAGSLADLKLGRFKVLMWSTYTMAVFEGLLLLTLVLISAAVNEVNYALYILIAFLMLASAGYYLGRVFFVTNVIQFGTDQLRDSPTNYSVMYICMFLWFDNLSHLLGNLVSTLSRNDTVLNARNKIVNVDLTQFLVLEVCLGISAISSVLILLAVQKYSNSFLTDKIKGNPYMLVYGVIKFAIKNKKPIKRSAFTYCNDERPSRMDYGKQIYGGPFTTEQVEDVKSLLRIAVVLIAAGFSVTLHLNGEITVSRYKLRHNYWSTNYYTNIFVNKGLLSQVLVFTCIPFYIIFVKPYFSRWIPNMFKRIGLGIITMNILFLLYFLQSSMATFSIDYDSIFQCATNTSYVPDRKFVSIPTISLQIFQKILPPLYQMLFYTAVWEFICCQSPQNMKGFLFGLFYSIKAVCQLLSAVSSSYLILISRSDGCKAMYFLLNLAIGFISLCIYTVLSRRYKYRKRDDICNIYKYAEDYYSSNS